MNCDKLYKIEYKFEEESCMLNIIWPIFIIISIVYAIFSGSLAAVNDSIFDTIDSTMTLIITLAGTMCFWSGIMNVLEKTDFFVKLKNVISKIIKIIFKKVDKDSEENEYISLNILSNILGLGNAATPMGIKAMDSMDKKNKNKKYMTKDMMMFILINTASIQIIPTTVIAIRASLGSNNASGMIFQIWIVSIIVFVSVITLRKSTF